jgi:hypothetical protein
LIDFRERLRMDSEDEYLYDATDSGNESPDGEEDEEDHVSFFFQY